MTAKPLQVSRAQVLAYRVAAQGLHGGDTPVADLAVLDIGVQQAMGHPAGLAFAARTSADVDVEIGPGCELAYVWSLRGAPHVHRRRDLDTLAGALWPLSEQDAIGRLNETGPSAAKMGMTGLEQYRAAVDVMRAVVTKPTAKGAASTAATKRLPPAMRRECRSCKTSHISDSAMRCGALAAGLELEPGTAPPVLLRRPKAKRPKKTDPAALAGLVRSYLHLLGPATAGDVAGYLDARRADLDAVWPDGLAQVSIDGRDTWLPEDCVAALRKPPDPDVVRLLGPFDPYLQARDRELLVPDSSVHKTLWPVLGRPGAVLADGEVAGTWRSKATKSMLTITVQAFAALPASGWKRLDTEAERVAEVRGVPGVRVVRD